MCAILSPSFKVKEFHIKDYVPFDVKLVYQGVGGKKAETIVFKKSEEFPYAKMLTLMKSDAFQVVGMYEHPNQIPYTDTYIGSWEVRNVTPLNGEPRKIKAKLRMNENGVFFLEAATTTEELPPEPEAEPMEQQDATTNEQPMEESQNDQNASNKDEKNEKESEPKEEKKEKKPKTKIIEYPIIETVPFSLNVDECILAEVSYLNLLPIVHLARNASS